MKKQISRSIVAGVSILLLTSGLSVFAGSTGETYKVKGKIYHPLTHVKKGYTLTGIASWYDIPTNFGVKTASGEKFDDQEMTAASPTLPMNTKIRVTNLKTHQSVVVRINDRGPYKHHRILDLSRAAAEKIGYDDDGITKVSVTVVESV